MQMALYNNRRHDIPLSWLLCCVGCSSNCLLRRFIGSLVGPLACFKVVPSTKLGQTTRILVPPASCSFSPYMRSHWLSCLPALLVLCLPFKLRPAATKKWTVEHPVLVVPEYLYVSSHPWTANSTHCYTMFTLLCAPFTLLCSVHFAVLRSLCYVLRSLCCAPFTLLCAPFTLLCSVHFAVCSVHFAVLHSFRCAPFTLRSANVAVLVFVLLGIRNGSIAVPSLGGRYTTLFCA